jgi:hypothetical protein
VSVYYNEKYPGDGVAWADLSSEKTTLVICLEQRGGICEPRLHIDQATPRTRYDMGYFIWVPANRPVHGYADLGYHLKTGHTLSVQNRPTGLAEDVIVLPCCSVHLQGLGLSPRSDV